MPKSQEQSPLSAPQESRAALPPVLDYRTAQFARSEKAVDVRPHSTYGRLWVALGLFAIISIMVSAVLGDEDKFFFLSLIMVIVFVLFVLGGVVFGILGLRQQSHQRTVTVVGLMLSGSMALTPVFLILYLQMNAWLR